MIDHFDLIWAGVEGLLSYLSLHVIMSLIPAFFLAWAISPLFSAVVYTVRVLGYDLGLSRAIAEVHIAE